NPAACRMDQQIEKGCNHCKNQQLHKGIAEKGHKLKGRKGILMPYVFHSNQYDYSNPVHKGSYEGKQKPFQ
ncbi:hypothetical protein, partial [Streptococcus gordonii]|uniref:hypothetical protein n=1 Tax=Streptococcus gordonii TaxID=1302 RepID=UPI001D0749A5